MKRLAIAGLIVVMGLALSAHAQSSGDGSVADDCAAGDVADAAPPAPPKLGADGPALRGEVTLLIRIDRCGRPLQVEVEKSSGQDLLDEAAATAARSWHLPAQTKDGVAVESQVRVPVRFDPDIGGPEPRATSRSRQRDAFFVARRSMRAKTPVLDGNGKVPGFVLDEYPIGVTDVQQAVAMLGRYGQRYPDPEAGMRLYEVTDEEGTSLWYIIGDPAQHAKSLFRQRAVSDGTRGFWVTSSLCENCDARLRRRFDEYLAGFPAQPDLPPPPPPPPPPPEE